MNCGKLPEGTRRNQGVRAVASGSESEPRNPPGHRGVNTERAVIADFMLRDLDTTRHRGG